MHTMWKGSISFGLVNIPIKMFAATEDKDVRFRQIHKECHTPVKYEKVCHTCNREVNQNEIARGYEYEPDRFVIVEDNDLEALMPEISKSIEIVDFVYLKNIDPIYFNKSYYLSPQDTGGKAYNLLKEAMSKTDKIAVARIVIREKESLAVVRTYKNLLVLETIFYPDEVRETRQIPGLPESVNLNENELNMATQLIENLTHEFEPEKYKNEYREKLLDLISEKAKGNEIVAKPNIPQTNVIDLMQALQASLQQTSKQAKEEVAEKKPEKEKKKKKEKATV